MTSIIFEILCFPFKCLRMEGSRALTSTPKTVEYFLASSEIGMSFDSSSISRRWGEAQIRHLCAPIPEYYPPKELFRIRQPSPLVSLQPFHSYFTFHFIRLPVAGVASPPGFEFTFIIMIGCKRHSGGKKLPTPGAMLVVLPLGNPPPNTGVSWFGVVFSIHICKALSGSRVYTTPKFFPDLS